MKYLASFSLVILFFVVHISYSKSISKQDDLQKIIIVYGSDTCHFCIDTKTYLKERKIEFTYYDVDVNLEKQREMVVKLQKADISLDNLSLPVVDLRGKLIMNGSDFKEFLKKLNTNNSKDENN
tara:strand:- start:34586 stop:34957 length:372 start_codon:yes stop_codon:yes gene_type:complete